MKLIKLNTDHYIIVDGSEINIGDIVAEKLLTGEYELFTIHTLNDIDKLRQKKITHSTQPESLGMGWMQSVLPLFLSEVKDHIGVPDVEKMIEVEFNKFQKENPIIPNSYFNPFKLGVLKGYNQALKDNKNNKYTEQDMRRYHNIMCLHGNKKGEEFIQSLQPKTEWEVEFIDGKLKLK